MEDKGELKFVGRLISTILICVTLIWATTYYVSHSSRNSTSPGSLGTEITRAIQVNGEGKVYGKPDIFKIQVSVSEIAQTTKEAQKKLNEGTKKVLDALKNNQIDDKDIQTIEISVSQEIEWNNTMRKVIGQRATQRFLVTVRNIQKDIERSGNVIDSLTLINGVEIGSMQFDIDDKTSLFTSARELAFKKADQKANELAKLGGLKLSKPVSIKETNQAPYYSPFQNAYLGKAADSMESSTYIPSGQIEIVVDLEISYEITK